MAVSVAFFPESPQKSLTSQPFMKRLVHISFLVLILVSVVSCNRNSITRIMKSKDVEYKYRKGEQFYATKKYTKAQIVFEDLFPMMRNDARFEDLYYKYAYCAYHLEDYLNAENLFKGFLDVFHKITKAPEVDYMRAYSFYMQSAPVELDQTATQKTIGLLQAHINNYPESPKLSAASEIIERCYEKIELKESLAADLYFKIGSFRAAAIAFTQLLNHYPQSVSADRYKYMIIRAYYQYAFMSVSIKQQERYEKVIEEYYDFVDRFPESKLTKDAEKYFQLSKTNLKNIKDEQTDKKS
jgi:outer membrane protein assembly factor BamD